jgi:chromosomal replication initiation ATPase DnaA
MTQRWAACLRELREQTTRATYNTWIARAHLDRLDRQEDGTCRATVACEDDYVRDWLQGRLDILIRRALAAAFSVDLAQLTVSYALERGSEGGDE